MFALTPAQNAQASTYFKGATNAILRKRPLTAWADVSGRVNRNFQGKDMNWLIEYMALEAQPYVPFQQGDFYDVNYHLQMAVQPVFWKLDSGMDITQIMMNTGPAQLVDLYNDRMRKLAEGMEIRFGKSLYNDVNSTEPGQGSKYMTGLMTFAHKSATVGVVTNAHRMAAPDETVIYAGQSIGLGSHGGSWSANLPAASRLNPILGTDYPDGQADASQRYDVTSPRLYNDMTNQWTNPGAAAANGTWRDNCLEMLSQADTDLKAFSVDAVMPNVHHSGSLRYQAIKSAMRSAFRYTMNPHGQSVNLGYPEVLDFEGAALTVDHECPAQFTFSLCEKSFEIDFYSGESVGAATAEAQELGGERIVTGGIYVLLGPTRDPRGGAWLFMIFAGGQIRWMPKYITIHGDFVNNG